MLLKKCARQEVAVTNSFTTGGPARAIRFWEGNRYGMKYSDDATSTQPNIKNHQSNCIRKKQLITKVMD
jgi:hypothetical protein